MSKVEIIMIVCALILPIIAFIIMRPKFKKKEKQKKEKKSKSVEISSDKPKEELQPIEVVEKVEKKEKVKPFDSLDTYSSDDFKDYLNKKQKSISKPSLKTPGMVDMSSLDDFMMTRRKKQEKKNTVESFDELSDEMQALIIAGAFDKKYFD